MIRRDESEMTITVQSKDGKRLPHMIFIIQEPLDGDRSVNDQLLSLWLAHYLCLLTRKMLEFVAADTDWPDLLTQSHCSVEKRSPPFEFLC